MQASPHPDIPILFKNDDILVISKPAGLPVHAGPGGGVTLDDYLPDFQFEKREPPHLAHRLDRDTSGCLILGRHKQALRILGRLFEQKRITKIYWAILDGIPAEKQMRIDMPMAKITDRKDRWHMQVSPDGQPAITELRILHQRDGKALVELKPKTGRTHQLRVHCAAIGCPITGDSLYGTAGTSLMLHARFLRIPYHQEDPPITVEAPLFPAMHSAAETLGFTV